MSENQWSPSNKLVLDLLKRIQLGLVTNRLVVRNKKDPEALELISVLSVVILGIESPSAIDKIPKVKQQTYEDPWEHA